MSGSSLLLLVPLEFEHRVWSEDVDPGNENIVSFLDAICVATEYSSPLFWSFGCAVGGREEGTFLTLVAGCGRLLLTPQAVPHSFGNMLRIEVPI